MPLSQASLANFMGPAFVEGSSAAIAQAFGDYMKNAVSNGVPISESAVDDTAVPAMESALEFVQPSTPEAGALIFVAGFAAFWAEMVAAPADFFVGATVITPPAALATLDEPTLTVFATNLSSKATKTEAANNLSVPWHAGAGLGGTATFGVPVSPIL